MLVLTGDHHPAEEAFKALALDEATRCPNLQWVHACRYFFPCLSLSLSLPAPTIPCVWTSIAPRPALPSLPPCLQCWRAVPVRSRRRRVSQRAAGADECQGAVFTEPRGVCHGWLPLLLQANAHAASQPRRAEMGSGACRMRSDQHSGLWWRTTTAIGALGERMCPRHACNGQHAP